MYIYHMHVFGFFSELINLTNALVWYKNITLDTEKWIGNYKNGLFDYLDCKELFINAVENSIHIGRQTPEQFQALVYARCNFDNTHFLENKISICKKLWKLSKPAILLRYFIQETLQLPSNYISIHIRRGDNDAFNKIPLSDYSNEINKHKNDNIFIMTDDESIIPEIKMLCSSKTIYYYPKNMNGWYEGDFYKVNPFDKYIHILHLIAEIEICRYSQWHIGSTSNVTRFLWFIHEKSTNFTFIDGAFDPV